MEPYTPKQVGKALDAPGISPEDPQEWLQESNHPYAPFVGNALKWDSYVYDDGTTYEGLTREDAPTLRGTLVLGHGLGGGLQQAQRGDKYEGEFHTGYVNGLGQYTGVNGEVYRGEWLYGKRHGCGALINTQPFLKRLEKGMEPNKAWEQAQADIEKGTIYGTWQADAFIVGPDSSGEFCHINEIKGVLQELDSVVTRTRMFQYKPDGEVTFRMAQDAVGLPAPLMQDPIHYPHGTKFMAPGPMGQCFPLPEDENVRNTMQQHAENHEKIFNMYNFDVVPKPGSDMDKAQKLWDKKEARKAARAKRAAELEKRRHQRLDRSRRPKGDEDTDLQASAALAAGGSRGQHPPTVFGSISLGFGRASEAAGCMLQSWTADVQRRLRPLLPPQA
jgi:hypothetical protein